MKVTTILLALFMTFTILAQPDPAGGIKPYDPTLPPDEPAHHAETSKLEADFLATLKKQAVVCKINNVYDFDYFVNFYKFELMADINEPSTIQPRTMCKECQTQEKCILSADVRIKLKALLLDSNAFSTLGKKLPLSPQELNAMRTFLLKRVKLAEENE